MRNMLALFAALLLTVGGVGWYLGWYKVRNQPASVPGQHTVSIDVDTKKVVKDLEKGEEKIQHMLENKAKEEAKKLPDVKKSADNLMLPSPGLTIQSGGSSLGVSESAKGPAVEFHSDKGPTFEVGGGKAPTLQFGDSNKGTFIQIGTTQPPK